MNTDYIIGSKQPHILFADYVGDTAKLTNATPESDGSKEAAKVASKDSIKNPDSDEHELTFDDFIDIINPLQHIPVVNYIYRAITGDKISGFAQVAGGAIYGGPLGLVGGVIEAAFNDETGHGPAETMVADVLGLEDHATMVANADRSPNKAANEPDWIDRQYASLMGRDLPAKEGMLETQLASAMPQPQTLDAQVAAAMPKAQTLDTQLAAATLPPVGPSPVQVAQTKMPYGGIMDMDLVNKARAGAPTIKDAPATGDMQLASTDQPLASAVPIAASIPNGTPNADAVAEGQKFYSLSKVKRLSPGTNIAMPIHSGPDVRLKPISRMAINSKTAAPSNVISIPTDNDAEARKILGLPEAGAPVAALDGREGEPNGNLTPDQADLTPAYGIKSQGLPSNLIEDMMKQGLDKYQRGLQNGTLGGGAPAIDVRG